MPTIRWFHLWKVRLKAPIYQRLHLILLFLVIPANVDPSRVRILPFSRTSATLLVSASQPTSNTPIPIAPARRSAPECLNIAGPQKKESEEAIERNGAKRQLARHASVWMVATGHKHSYALAGMLQRVVSVQESSDDLLFDI